MPDFSLVPVDHQPDFSDVTLVPVDHDPFSADCAIQQAGTQPESQSQRAPTYNDPEGDAAAMSPEANIRQSSDAPATCDRRGEDFCCTQLWSVTGRHERF
jgi:hypothetical protein